MYRIWLEDVLGFRLRGDQLRICPAIPQDWPGFELVYKYRTTAYEITVKREKGSAARMELDGRPVESSTIRLTDDGARHRVTVRLAPSEQPNLPVQQNTEQRLAPRLVL
jgi:cellobiose phosphorylase